MNVDFTPDQQPLVQQAIESGRIHRPEDAAREAFSLWAEQERRLAEHRAINSTQAQEVVARILELRKGNMLPEGVTIRDLIHEGPRLTVFVLDNSVTMRWCFQNAAHPYADSVLKQLASGEAFVPVLWRYEVSAVLAKSQKDGILTAAKAEAFLATVNSLNITLDRDGADRIFTDVHRLAVIHRLTSYDAAYPGTGYPKEAAFGNA